MRQGSTSIMAACLGLASLNATQTVHAATWSDTFLGYHLGNKFAEPYGTNDITKNIFTLSHVSGYEYGTNFFNVDLLLSDAQDPAFGDTSFNGSNTGAQEVYIVYRNTLSFSSMTGSEYKFGSVKDVGLTFGFDANAKADAGYNSKKQMFVLGPTLNMDVPGFMSISLLALWESNSNYSTYFASGVERYHYDMHTMISLAWGIPIGDTKLSFDGFANIIASKGKDEFGADTAAETLIDLNLMYKISDSFKAGLEYQYWKNKFGNDAAGPAGPGAFAKTPMLRAEYHF